MYGIILLGRKSCIRDLKFKIYWVLKSIPAAKPQTSGDILEPQKPAWAKFFYLKRQGYTDISRTKINLWSHHIHI